MQLSQRKTPRAAAYAYDIAREARKRTVTPPLIIVFEVDMVFTLHIEEYGPRTMLPCTGRLAQFFYSTNFPFLQQTSLADSTLKCNGDLEEYFMGSFHVQGFAGSVIELVHHVL